MTYAGVDPGLKGAIAFIRGGRVVETRVMPTVPTGKGNKRTIDHVGLREWLLLDGETPDFLLLEEQQVMPPKRTFGADGEKTYAHAPAVSSFTVGFNYGALVQAVTMLGIPFERIHAKTWQKDYGIGGAGNDTKQQGRMVCQQLFPSAQLLATTRSKVPHEGIVDAVLIAEYARRRRG